jgi:hypothetical protein
MGIKSSENPMIGFFCMSSFVGMLICASLLMRHFYRAHRSEWEKEGRPIGPLWAPPELREELICWVGSKSSRAGSSMLIAMLVLTPETFREDMRPSTRALLYTYRTLFLLSGILLVISLIAD